MQRKIIRVKQGMKLIFKVGRGESNRIFYFFQFFYHLPASVLLLGPPPPSINFFALKIEKNR